MINAGKKVHADNYVHFYCLRYNKNGHYSVPFFAINDSFARNRIYLSIITGTAPDLIFDTDVTLVRVFSFHNQDGSIFNSRHFDVCNILDIEGVKEFIENVKKSDTVFENAQKGDN